MGNGSIYGKAGEGMGALYNGDKPPKADRASSSEARVPYVVVLLVDVVVAAFPLLMGKAVEDVLLAFCPSYLGT